MDNKVFAWLVAGTALILSVPAVLMYFQIGILDPGDDIEVLNWGSEDFIVIGSLLFGAGSMFVLIARVTPRKYRALIGVGTVMAVLWLWVELAVGLFTTWGS